MLSITKDGVEIEFIPLKTGSNTEDIISRERIEEKKLQEQKLAEIKSTVTKASLEERLTIVDIAKGISDNQNFPTHIKDDVTHRLEEMMGALTKEYHSVRPYHIVQMSIKNFQSHKDTVIDFDPGLNVFIGESGEGKSAIQRAFWFVFDKAKINPKNFIHKGEKECSVTLQLSDGTTITRFVTTSGKNGYKIYDAQSGQTYEGNTTLAPLAQQLLGYAPLALDEKTTMPLNFLKQGEGWYFIGSHVTGPMRAKVIGSFYQTHYADAVMKDLENESKKVVTELKQVTSKVEELDERLVEYNYLDTLEERLALASEKQEALTEMIYRYQKLKALYLKKLELEELLSRHEEAYHTLKPLTEQLEQRYEVIVANSNRFQRLRQLHHQLIVAQHEENRWSERSTSFIDMSLLYQKYSTLHQATLNYQRLHQLYAQFSMVHASLTHHESLTTKFQSVEPLYEKLNALKGLGNHFYQQHRVLQFMTHRLTQYRELESLIQTGEMLLPKLPDLEKASTLYQEIRSSLERQTQLTQLYTKLAEVFQLGRQESAQLSHYKQLLETEVANYRALLQELKQCPVCLSEISNDTVTHIIAKQLNQTIK